MRFRSGGIGIWASRAQSQSGATRGQKERTFPTGPGPTFPRAGVPPATGNACRRTGRPPAQVDEVAERTSAEQQALAAERQQFESERDSLEAGRAVFSNERAELQSTRAALQTQREELEATLAAERERFESLQAELSADQTS